MHADDVDQIGDGSLGVPHCVEDATAGRFGDYLEYVQSHPSNIRLFIYMCKRIF
jgi:hypothetical protein